MGELKLVDCTLGFGGELPGWNFGENILHTFSCRKNKRTKPLRRMLAAMNREGRVIYT